MIERSELTRENVPMVRVTLTPIQTDNRTTDSKNEATESPLTPKQMASSPSSSHPIPPPIQPITSQYQPLRNTSALHLNSPSPKQETHDIPHQKRRMLKDTFAADTLFAQSATKMMKRKSTNVSTPLPSLITTQTEPLKSRSIPSSLQANIDPFNPASTPASPRGKRRLTTRPPDGASAGKAKIGVRHSVSPVYPRVAKEEGWQGIVILRVLVRTNGRPGEITIQKSSGHEILDKAAIEAVRKWEFTPAMDGNFPIEKYLQIPLNFGLRG